MDYNNRYKSQRTQWNNGLIGLNTPKYIFESIFLPDLKETNINNELFIKSHSFLLFGAAGNGKTFFVNNLFEICQCQKVIIECWELNEFIDEQYFVNQKEKIIIYFKDIDALFNLETKSKIKEAFIRFTHTKSNNFYIIADTNKASSITKEMTELFDHKIYFNFPTSDERLKMLKFHLPNDFSQKVIDFYIEKSNGFTFSDIIILIKKVKMYPIIKLIKLNNGEMDSDKIEYSENDLSESLYSMHSSYSKTERNKFSEIAQEFCFIL